MFHIARGAGLERVIDFSRAEGDRIQIEDHMTYTVTQTGADTLIDFGGGDQVLLVGVQTTSLTGAWIFDS